MKDSLKGIGAGIIWIIGLLALIFLVGLFMKGTIWLGAKVLPTLIKIAGIVFIFDILILFPLLFPKRTRPYAGMGLAYSSFAYGATLWFMGLLLSYLIWGWLAVVAGLFIFGVGVVPIALLATALKGMWSYFFQLLFLFVLTFGTRAFGIYIADKEY
jgi:hypothetical protein